MVTLLGFLGLYDSFANIVQGYITGTGAIDGPSANDVTLKNIDKSDQ